MFGEDAVIYLLWNWKPAKNNRRGRPRSKRLEEVVEDLKRARRYEDFAMGTNPPRITGFRKLSESVLPRNGVFRHVYIHIYC